MKHKKGNKKQHKEHHTPNDDLANILSSVNVDRGTLARRIWSHMPNDKLEHPNSYFTEQFGKAIAEAGMKIPRDNYSVKEVKGLTIITYKTKPYLVKVAPNGFDDTDYATLNHYIRDINEDRRDLRKQIAEKERKAKGYAINSELSIFVGLVLYVPVQMFGNNNEKNFKRQLPETQFVDLGYNAKSIDTIISALREGRM